MKQVPWSPWHDRLHQKLRESNELLPKGSSLLLSVSGGQDSMALIKLISDLQRIYQWDLHVWHGDHRWHKNSEKISTELKKWCETHHLDFHYDIAEGTEVKTEEDARNWRYNKLIQKANYLSSKYKMCNHVLTGHTSSDRTETVLLNLARGSDLAGLCSLNQIRSLTTNIKLVRPILCFSRNETKKICEEMDLPVWIDPANLDSNFSRNRIRNEVMPVLEDLHPGCSLRISSLSERLSEYRNNYEAIAVLALQSISNSDGLLREKLSELPINSRAILLSLWLKRAGAPGLSSNRLEEITQKITPTKPPGSMNLPNDWSVNWTKKVIQVNCQNQKSSGSKN